ncbi:MAG: T9SS type A sorting domain-containing protein, partial [Crocinitomicaceae bacterium]|nr:T9SS type A sorting domain-containing protein [Crocinitomicaceae bacterium]
FGANGDDITYQIQIDEATGEIYVVYEDTEFAAGIFNNDGASATIGLNGPSQDITVSYNNATYLQNNSCVHYFYTDCPAPTNYTVTYTTSDEGAITWGAGLAGETNWTVEYGPAGFTLGTGITVQTGTSALIMPSLNDLTTYDVYIYADCSPVLQSTGITGQFTTLPNCANPSAITTTTAIDSLMSGWSWTENVGFPSTGFGIQYGWSGFTPGNGTTVWVDNNYTDTTADVSLMAGGVYQMYVQAVCATDSSAWTGPIQFIMPLTNDSTCLDEDLMVDGTMYTFNNGGATTAVNELTIVPPATGYQTQTGWGNSNLNSSVWYTFTAPASGNVRVNCAGINFDGQVAAYEVTDCADFATYTLIGANDDGPNNVNPPLMNLCGLTPGNQYYIMYDSWSTTATGSYNMTLTEVVVNAGTDNGLADICLGDTANLFLNITGYDAGGVWYETIPTANFMDSLFVSAGLASQEFTFDYVVTDGCAIDSVSASVEIYAPSSAGNDGTILVCMNQPLDLLDGLSGNVDLGGDWYDPGNNIIGSSAITASAIPGQFNYDYITGNGVCPDDTANVIVDVDFNCDYTNVQELYFNAMDIHPNPTTGMVYISNDGSTEVFNMELTDLNGKVITTQSAAINGAETTEVSLETLETGIYLIRVYNDNAAKTFRIVKQ